MCIQKPSDSSEATPGDGQAVYRMKDVQQHNSEDDCWTVINGKVYDITAWVPRHPGGGLIRQGAGTDSTGMFESSHPPQVARMLPKYLVGSLHPDDAALSFYTYDSEFWRTLQQRVWGYFKEKNVSRHDTREYYTKALVLMTGFLVCYFLGFVQGNLLFVLMASIIAPFCAISVMHDGQHGAASRYPTVNAVTGWVVDFFGASGFVWRHEHNIGHHQHTNTVADVDPDAHSGAPFVRFSPQDEQKPWHQYQHLYVWVMYAVIMPRWYVSDIQYFLEGAYSSIPFYKPTQLEKVLFWAGKATYFTYAFLIPVYCHGLYGLLYSALLLAGASYVFAFQFTVNHLTEDAHWPKARSVLSQERDWAKLQVMTSCNYSPGNPVADWLSAGLNYQIEHHLFPTICHTHYTKISPIVRQTCKEFGVFYPCIPTYGEAIASHYKQLRRLGQPQKQL